MLSTAACACDHDTRPSCVTVSADAALLVVGLPLNLQLAPYAFSGQLPASHGCSVDVRACYAQRSRMLPLWLANYVLALAAECGEA